MDKLEAEERTSARRGKALAVQLVVAIALVAVVAAATVFYARSQRPKPVVYDPVATLAEPGRVRGAGAGEDRAQGATEPVGTSNPRR